MTHEWHPADGTGKTGEVQEMEDILEQRLKFYYGPKLPEQPLPESSWQQVSSKLGSQRQRSRWKRHLGRHFWPRFKRQRNAFPFPTNAFPSDSQEAFARILLDAHLSHSPRMLACRSTARVQVPNIRISLLRRRPLRLTQPTLIDIKPVELDVLLAGGLARYEEMCRPTSILVYVLSMGTIASLLVWAMIALFQQGLSLFTRFFDVFVCISLTGVILWLINIHARKLARRADTKMVSWIGRFRACQGLHALADRSRVPSQRRWGELSLTERIARICGTRVAMQEEHFTLVR
jgi:hypothetical protein